MYFLIITFLMFLALVVQHFLGEVPGMGGHILLMPVLFFYGAAAFPLWGTLALALLAGIMWDSTILQLTSAQTEIAFGWSILLYAGLGSIMNGLRPLFQRGHWLIHCILTGILTTFLVLAEYLVITFRREPLLLFFPAEVWLRMLGSGLAAATLAIPIFMILNWIASYGGFLKPEKEID